MKTGQHELTGFERRLLDELRRTIVANGLRPTSPPAVRPGLGWRRRLTLAAAIAVAAALALTAGIPFVDRGSTPPVSGPSAAYAVTTNEDGTVIVEINALRDAKDLERELRQAGVPAEVQYLPPGDACSEGAFALVRPAGSGAGAIEAREHGSMRFEIDKTSLQPGQKLFIYTVDVASGEPAASIGISIVDDKFSGCSR
jgi:hypothetical protein